MTAEKFKKFVFTAAALSVLALTAACTTKESKEKTSRLSEKEYREIVSDFNALNQISLSDEGINAVEGAKDGYIVIHKFMDFQCSHCYDTSFVLKKALKRWPGRIKIVYRQFPLDGTCNPNVKNKQEGAYSCNGAQAAICIAEKPYFSDFYHELFAFQPEHRHITIANLEGLVKSHGGNFQELLSCMGSARTAALLNKDLKDAEKVNVRSTPTLVVNGRLLPAGTPNEEYFFYLMDALVLEKEGMAAFGG